MRGAADGVTELDREGEDAWEGISVYFYVLYIVCLVCLEYDIGDEANTYGGGPKEHNSELHRSQQRSGNRLICKCS